MYQNHTIVTAPRQAFVDDIALAESLAVQPWQIDAIESLLIAASYGTFRGAGSYWANRWGKSRRTADRLLSRLVRVGLFEIAEPGDRNNPRKLTRVRGFKIGAQSNDAHSIVLVSLKGKPYYSSRGKYKLLQSFIGTEPNPPVENGAVNNDSVSVNASVPRSNRLAMVADTPDPENAVRAKHGENKQTLTIGA